MNKDPEGPDKERDESEAEREDRKYDDLLQELRVIQTSAQLTAGFLLTLPFQQRFADLSTAQERFYLVLVVLAALVTAAVLGPVATHRQLSGRRVKGQPGPGGAHLRVHRARPAGAARDRDRGLHLRRDRRPEHGARGRSRAAGRCWRG